MTGRAGCGQGEARDEYWAERQLTKIWRKKTGDPAGGVAGHEH